MRTDIEVQIDSNIPVPRPYFYGWKKVAEKMGVGDSSLLPLNDAKQLHRAIRKLGFQSHMRKISGVNWRVWKAI